MPKTYTVEVTSPERGKDMPHGYFSMGKHFPPGEHVVEEVTKEQLKELQRDGKAGRLFVKVTKEEGEEDPVPEDLGTLTNEEKQLVAEARARKAAVPGGAGPKVTSKPGYGTSRPVTDADLRDAQAQAEAKSQDQAKSKK